MLVHFFHRMAFGIEPRPSCLVANTFCAKSFFWPPLFLFVVNTDSTWSLTVYTCLQRAYSTEGQSTMEKHKNTPFPHPLPSTLASRFLPGGKAAHEQPAGRGQKIQRLTQDCSVETQNWGSIISLDPQRSTKTYLYVSVESSQQLEALCLSLFIPLAAQDW